MSTLIFFQIGLMDRVDTIYRNTKFGFFHGMGFEIKQVRFNSVARQYQSLLCTKLRYLLLMHWWFCVTMEFNAMISIWFKFWFKKNGEIGNCIFDFSFFFQMLIHEEPTEIGAGCTECINGQHYNMEVPENAPWDTKKLLEVRCNTVLTFP